MSLFSLINLTKSQWLLSGAVGVAAPGLAEPAIKYLVQQGLCLYNKRREADGQYKEEQIQKISATVARYLSIVAGLVTFASMIFLFTAHNYSETDVMPYEMAQEIKKTELFQQILR
jgi:hypothetical protein